MSYDDEYFGFPKRKIRDAETWARVRRGWEQGETAGSLARRFDVGLANLWRRRTSEGWSRAALHDARNGRPEEPLEGWAAFARRRRDEFDAELTKTRELALTLARMMTGQAIRDVSAWQMPFLLAFRAEHLGAEVAAGDRAAMKDQPWAGVVWREDGTLRPVHEADARMVMFLRADWRAWAGLPDEAAEEMP